MHYNSSHRDVSPFQSGNTSLTRLLACGTPVVPLPLTGQLCRQFHEFKKFNQPLLLAISRKTFIGDLLSRKLPEERLAGSLALTTLLLSKGADIVRCHDVKETRDAIIVYETMENTG